MTEGGWPRAHSVLPFLPPPKGLGLRGEVKHRDQAARSRHTLDSRCPPGWGRVTVPGSAADFPM